jgi:membrane-associated phospholipid phosphatase
MKSFPQFFQKLLAAQWQSLLLLFLGVVLPLLVVEQFTIVILNQGTFAWDKAILLAIHNTTDPILDRIAITITPLGVFYGVFPISALVSIGLLYQRKWRKLTYLLVTLLGSAVINWTAKIWLHRDRPDFWESLTPHTDFSFPSGHAMSSMSLVATLVILTWGTRWCGWTSAIGGLFVLVIAWTRLYLGVHFPSDIVAGWMISLAWAIGVSLVVRPQLESSIEQTTVLPEELQSTQS